ncbi:hypothetical protein D9757_003024 [Collybiopsis confluens]|uniref:Chromo domain-containing protein n=1 Tax=Collybiopsis confluens TaxID=2823264 RepID=A0A8H5MEK0_9AGAR|nr:hypothetical protein D9757_003024 [Collybiopsis confluens]
MARTKKKVEQRPAETDETFQVEYFKKVKVNEDGKWRYLVKWYGYDDSDDDTWEPQKNIANCQRLLSSFWQEIGVDDEDYKTGWEGIPTKKWIKKEKAYFAANHKERDRQKRLEAQRAREIEQEKKKEENKKKQKTIVKKEKASETSDSDVPLSTPLKGKQKANSIEFEANISKINKKRKRSVEEPDERGKKKPPPPPNDKEGSAVLPEKNPAVSLFSSPPDEPIKSKPPPLRNPSLSSFFSPPSSAEPSRNDPVAKAPNSIYCHTSRPSVAQSSTASSTPTLPTPRWVGFQAQNLPQPQPAEPAFGISTKQRLMQRALEIHTPTTKLSEPSQKSMSVNGAHVNLAARASPTAPEMQMREFRSSSSLTPTISTPTAVRQPSIDNNLGPSLSRIQSRPSSVESSASVSSMLRLSQTPVQSPVISALPPPVSAGHSSKVADEAENFLRSIPLPLQCVLCASFSRPCFYSTSARYLSATSRIESPCISPLISASVPRERALWTGKILMHTGQDYKLQTVCSEGMLMPSNLTGEQTGLKRGEMPLKVAMTYIDAQLSIESFYKTNILDPVLSAFNPVQEQGWLCAGSEEEMKNLNKVAQFLHRRKLVGSVPIIVEGKSSALLVLHASTLVHKRLPAASPNELTVNVALFTWMLGADKREQPWKHHSDILGKAWLRRDPKLPQGLYQPRGETGAQRDSSSEAMVKHGVRMLEFPEMLHSYLASESERSFSLWPSTASEAFQVSKIPAIEQEMLIATMKQYHSSVNRGVVSMEVNTHLKILFLHANSLGAGLGNVRNMPGLAKYRSLNDVRFLAYGSSDIVNLSLANIIEEIWPIGGLVTFTPGAIRADPLGTYQRLRQIEQHESWACFVLPAAIGMVISSAYHDKQSILQNRIACPAFNHPSHSIEREDARMNVDDNMAEIFGGRMDIENTTSFFSGTSQCKCRGEFAHEWVLQAIEDEWISIVGAPPFPASDSHSARGSTIVHKDVVRDAKPRRKDEWEKYSSKLLASVSTSLLWSFPASTSPVCDVSQYKDDGMHGWVSEMFENDIRSRSQTLAYCIAEFERLCHGLPQDQWEERIRKEIVDEMDRFQVTRPFRENYRRFVVLVDDKDKHLGSNASSFEWVTPETFKFHDNTDKLEADSLFA